MSQPAVRQQLVTAEEFWDLCHRTSAEVELVDGEVLEMAPAGPAHGRFDRRLIIPLGSYVEERGLGETYLNTGFILGRDPDLVRGPDQAFVSHEKILAHPPPEQGFWEVVPDLVVEIVSPNDTAAEINAKVRDYLEAGVRLVWVLYPRTQQVNVYRPGQGMEIVLADGELRGDDVLPGFRLPLLKVWR